MKYIFTLLIIITLFTITAYADAEHQLKGRHLENKLNCVDCHSEEQPTGKAPQAVCRSCHGDMKDSESIITKNSSGHDVKLNPHASHAGDIRCTKCHSIHKTSALFCNEGCHHRFELNVP